MQDKERLATIHVLPTHSVKEQIAREARRYNFEASGEQLRHALRALLGRMKWHAARVENQYGYTPRDAGEELLAHMALSTLAAEIEEQLSGDGWDTGDAQQQLTETGPAMWVCYQQYEAGQPITGRYTKELSRKAEAQRQAYAQAKASVASARKKAKAAAKPSAKAAREDRAARDERRAHRAAQAEAKHKARLAKRDAQKGKP